MPRSDFPGILFLIFGILLILCMPVSAYSGDAVRWYDTGNTFLQAKNYTSAVGAYDHAIALEPAYFEAWDNKADALNRAGQYTDALAASTRALEIQPGYTKGWINRGQILYNIGYYYEDQLHDMAAANDYYTEQLLTFDKAIGIEPDNAEAWFNKGYALAGMKRYDEAIAAFDKVKDLDPAYPKLNLSRNQAEVLRNNAMPFYIRYSVPLAGALIILIAGAGIYLWNRSIKTKGAGDPAQDNRQSRRRKER